LTPTSENADYLQTGRRNRQSLLFTTNQLLRVVIALLPSLMVLMCALNSAGQGGPPSIQLLDIHLSKGYEAIKSERYDDAVREFRAALALDPSLVERAQFPLAVALFELHRHSEARQELESVRRKVGDHPNVLYYLGRLEIEERNFPAAIRDLNNAATKPPFPDTAYYLGFAYFEQHDLWAAEKWLKAAVRINARDVRAPYQLGLVYRELGRQQDAKKWLAISGKLRQRDQREGALKLECADKLNQGLREEAHKICEQLYDADNADKLTSLGTIYAQHRDLEAALKPFQRAAELSPQSPQVQYNLALAYFELNQFDKARSPLATALQRWPDLFQLNALYGVVLLRLGEEMQSYRALHYANELNQDDSATADVLFSLVVSLGQKNQNAEQYPEASHMFEEAVRLRPQDPGPHQRLAEIYKSMGRQQQSLSEQQAAEHLMNNADAK
jgi:tetratricopeptide (TPR) repeat protein